MYLDHEGNGASRDHQNRAPYPSCKFQGICNSRIELTSLFAKENIDRIAISLRVCERRCRIDNNSSTGDCVNDFNSLKAELTIEQFHDSYTQFLVYSDTCKDKTWREELVIPGAIE